MTRRAPLAMQAGLWMASLATLAYATAPSYAAEAAAIVGRSVAEVLRDAQSAGIRIIFTDRLVPPNLRVDAAPSAADRLEAVREILLAHALVLEEIDSGVYVVKRAPRAKTIERTRSELEKSSDSPEQVQVSASRYEIDLTTLGDSFALNRTDLETQPALANDAARAIRRFPGTAGNDVSARTHVRGGSVNENLILLDGVPLHDPFHLGRLPVAYSIIDPSVLGSAEFFSGVLPIEYDGYMSSMLSMHLREPAESVGGRVAVGFLDMSGFLSGQLPGEQNDWLFFSRRGVRGTVLDPVKPGIGKPRALDNLARVRFRADDHSLLSFGAFAADDSTYFTERDFGDMTNDASRHRYAWAAYEKRWDEISSRTLLTYTSLESTRQSNLLNDWAGSKGSGSDERSSDIAALRQDWRLPLRGDGALRWGLSGRYDEARLYYSRHVTLPEDVAALFKRSPLDSAQIDESVSLRQGEAYVGVTRPLSARVTVDGGAHWVRSAYSTNQVYNAWDPRLGLLFDATSATRLRFSIGRMSQTFAAIDLPVERDRLVFDDMPSSTMAVLALEHDLSRNIAIRLEGYSKHVDHPQPRLENVFVPDAFLPELRADAYVVAPQSSDVHGLDLYVAAKVTERLSGWFTYSWSQATDEIEDEHIRRAWNQPHALATGLTYENHGWLLSSALSAHSSWPLTPLFDTRLPYPSNPPALPVDQTFWIGPKNSLRDGYYVTLDVKAGKRLRLDPGFLELSVEVSNATDRSNKCCNETAFLIVEGDPRTQAAQGARFWQPLRPYVSISWEF